MNQQEGWVLQEQNLMRVSRPSRGRTYLQHQMGIQLGGPSFQESMPVGKTLPQGSDFLVKNVVLSLDIRVKPGEEKYVRDLFHSGAYEETESGSFIAMSKSNKVIYDSSQPVGFDLDGDAALNDDDLAIEKTFTPPASDCAMVGSSGVATSSCDDIAIPLLPVSNSNSDSSPTSTSNSPLISAADAPPAKSPLLSAADAPTMSTANTPPISTNMPPLLSAADAPPMSAAYTPPISTATTPLISAADAPLMSAANTPPISTNTSPLLSAADAPLMSAANTPPFSTNTSPLLCAADAPPAKSPLLSVADAPPMSAAKTQTISTSKSQLIPAADAPPMYAAYTPPISIATSPLIPAADAPSAKSPLLSVADAPLMSAANIPLISTATSPLISAADAPPAKSLLLSVADAPLMSAANTSPISTASSPLISAADAPPIKSLLLSAADAPPAKSPLLSVADAPPMSAANTPPISTTLSPLISAADAPLMPAANTPTTSIANTPANSTTNTPCTSTANTPPISTAYSRPVSTANTPQMSASNNTPPLTATNFKANPRHIILMLLLIGNMMGGASGKKFFLDETCMDFLEENYHTVSSNECPNIHALLSESKVTTIHEKCCPRGEKLHCQMDETNTLMAAGCLPERLVPPGHILILNTSGVSLQYEVHLCEDKDFEENYRNSTTIVRPYCCHRKTTCTGEGEEIQSFGGTVEDNKCRCKMGFKPLEQDCNTFTDDHHCSCVPMLCEPGTVQRALPPPANCTGQVCENLELEYTCVSNNFTSDASSPSPTLSKSTPGLEPSTVSNENGTEINNGTEDTTPYVSIFVPLGIVAVVVVVVVLLIKFPGIRVILQLLLTGLVAVLSQAVLTIRSRCTGKQLDGAKGGTVVYSPANQDDNVDVV